MYVGERFTLDGMLGEFYSAWQFRGWITKDIIEDDKNLH